MRKLANHANFVFTSRTSWGYNWVIEGSKERHGRQPREFQSARDKPGERPGNADPSDCA